MIPLDLKSRQAYKRAKQNGGAAPVLHPPGKIVGIGGNWPVPALPGDAIPTNPTISPPVCNRAHPIPDDSALADYRDFMRGISEAPDSWLVAPMLAVVARLLTPSVCLDFGGYKPVTLFQFLAGPAGLRKSTSVNPAERIAAILLPAEALLLGNASDSALFDTFEKGPHRLQIEDEGNTIIRTWSNSHYGREVAARYLKLYDGQPWAQNFRREAKNHDDGEAERRIDRATLSLVIASTFGVSRFEGVDAATGLRRRFGYYVEEASARRIDWPAAFGDAEAEELAEKFRPLLTLSGTLGKHSFARGAWEEWQTIQRVNRDESAAITGVTAAQEAAGAALNESPMRILKLAIIFQVCRWLKKPSLNPLELNTEALRIAHAHQADCLTAAAQLDTLSRRVAIADAAEAVLARIRTEFAPFFKEGMVALTQTQLTNKFASHPERANALTAARLYGEIIPKLIHEGKAREIPQPGKKRLFAFHAED